MPGVRSLLTQVFGKQSLLAGLTLRKKGRSFGIKRIEQADLAGVDLDLCRNWPAGRQRADGLFLCLPANATQFLVVLVELKGGHVEEAVKQVRTTATVLRRGPGIDIHGGPACLSLSDHGNLGHEGRVLGVIVSQGGLPAEQSKRKQLLTEEGPTIKIRSTRKLVVTLDELQRWTS